MSSASVLPSFVMHLTMAWSSISGCSGAQRRQLQLHVQAFGSATVVGRRCGDPSQSNRRNGDTIRTVVAGDGWFGQPRQTTKRTCGGPASDRGHRRAGCRGALLGNSSGVVLLCFLVCRSSHSLQRLQSRGMTWGRLAKYNVPDSSREMLDPPWNVRGLV